jgi:hypothetical protein
MKQIMLTLSTILAIAMIGIGMYGLYVYGTMKGKTEGVVAVQMSCDDEKQNETMINGKSYFCMDTQSFRQMIAHIMAQRQS